MSKKMGYGIGLCGLAAILIGVVMAPQAIAGGRGDEPIIYVTSQDLFYDSIITADPLPLMGPFQELEMAGQVFDQFRRDIHVRSLPTAVAV